MRRRSGSRRIGTHLGHSSPMAGSSGGGGGGGTGNAGCHLQLPSVACKAPRGAESCSSLKAPSWWRHSSLPRPPGDVFRLLATHSGRAAKPLTIQWLTVVRQQGRPKPPIPQLLTPRSWRSTRDRVVAGMLDPEDENGDRAVTSPPRPISEHNVPPSVPPPFAGDCAKLAELMRCCDGLQELM